MAYSKKLSIFVGLKNKFMEQFAQKIKDARKAKRLSRRELAQKSNVSDVSIYYIEKGQMPSLKTLSRLCEVLGFDITLTPKKQ